MVGFWVAAWTQLSSVMADEQGAAASILLAAGVRKSLPAQAGPQRIAPRIRAGCDYPTPAIPSQARSPRSPVEFDFPFPDVYDAFMRLEYYDEKKMKKEVLAILAKYLDLKKYKVFFFGSRVCGGGTDRSDVDIGIEGEARVPAAAWSRIQEEIENFPVLYKLEVVDFKQVTPEFKEVAEQNIELIFP